MIADLKQRPWLSFADAAKCMAGMSERNPARLLKEGRVPRTITVDGIDKEMIRLIDLYLWAGLMGRGPDW